jgi:hypothetical protein
MAEEDRAAPVVRHPPWGRSEMGDAGAVFLASFGLLVFVQLVLGFAGGGVPATGPVETARILAVALLGGALAALGWEVERQRRARRHAVRRWWTRRRREPGEAVVGTVDTSPELTDMAEALSDPESAPEPTPPVEPVFEPAPRRWRRFWDS